MEENFHPTASYVASGSLARLRARLISPINWFSPAWAALCGAVVSGSFGWQGDDWLRLGLLILVVDVGWGVLWTALGSTDWATPLSSWRDWRSGDPVTRPPYTLPGSPGDRATRWLGHLRGWWRHVVWPTCGLSLSMVLVALLGTAVLAVNQGAHLLLLTAGALALMQLGVAWEGGRGTAAPKWDALLAVALPWLAGDIVFSGSLALGSAGLGIAFALAWGAAWGALARWERVLGIGAQLLAAVFLIVLRSSLAAGCLLLLLVPQLLLLPWLKRDTPAAWYVRYARPWMMVAMLVAAWAL
jgi:hypothetical protein